MISIRPLSMSPKEKIQEKKSENSDTHAKTGAELHQAISRSPTANVLHTHHTPKADPPAYLYPIPGSDIPMPETHAHKYAQTHCPDPVPKPNIQSGPNTKSGPNTQTQCPDDLNPDGIPRPDTR